MTDARRTDPPPQRGSFSPYGAVLSECRKLFSKRSCAVLSGLHGILASELEELRRDTSDAEYAVLLTELLRAMRFGSDSLEHHFSIAYEQVSSELATKRPWRDNRLYGSTQRAQVEITLVDEHVFAQTLSVKGQANILHNTCETELRELTPRIAMMMGRTGDGDLDPADNPLGPEAVAQALKHACCSLECPAAAQDLLFGIATRNLAMELPAVYRDVNKHLTERRVLPRARPSVKRGGGAGRNAPLRQHSPQEQAETADTLRRLVAPTQHHHGVPQGGTFSNIRGGTNVSPAVLDALTRLQLGAGEVVLGGNRFSVDTSTADTVNVLRTLVDAGIGKQLGSLDNIVIDVVATLFDFIFDDDRVPEAMKGLIGRLQLPVLKLAMTDHSFFSNRSHPARRMINGMSQAAATWDGKLTPDTSLYRACEPIVQRIQNEASNDAHVFESALETLEIFLAQQEQHADEKAATLTSRLAAREQLEIARTVAGGAIARYVEDANVPEQVRLFLHERWLGTLADAARAEGEDGERWQAAVATMDDLVWSVRPKNSAEERRRLVELLPGLLERLQQGLEVTKADDAARSRFFAELVKLHAIAVKSGMIPAPQTVAPLPGAEPKAAAEEPDWIALDELHRGVWVELQLETGERCAVRLTWVSPARTMYLFANRQGARALALTRAELGRKFASGEALVIDDEPLMDRLVANVLNQYQPSAQGSPP